MIGPAQVLPLLLQRGLLTRERVVAEGLRVSGTRCRNSSYHVTGADGRGFFLKQLGPRDSAGGGDAATLGSVQHEAAIYELFASPHTPTALRRQLPRCIACDPAGDVLILTAIPGAEDLRSYHERRRRFPLGIARATGRALGRLHQLTAPWRESADLRRRLPAGQLPFVFRLPAPPASLLADASAGAVELVTVLQENAPFGAAFAELARTWRTASLIHGDVRLANLVVERRRAGGAVRRVVLVDWEFACLGEPLWDVGALLASHIALWLTSVPIAQPDDPGALLHLARFPLQRIQPALQEFWQAYGDARGWDEATAAGEAVHASRYLAVSLVHTAYELALRENKLSTEVRALLQVSLNVLEAPAAAARDLLCLTPRPMTVPS